VTAPKQKNTYVAGTDGIREVFRRLAKDPMGLIGLVIVISFITIALFADILAPYDPAKINILSKLQGPSLEYLLGTDQLGRDTLSRLIHGAQIALMVAAISIGVAVVIGLLCCCSTQSGLTRSLCLRLRLSCFLARA